jgi:hypothetical protein
LTIVDARAMSTPGLRVTIQSDAPVLVALAYEVAATGTGQARSTAAAARTPIRRR